MHPQPADTEPRICTKTHSATQTAGTHETPQTKVGRSNSRSRKEATSAAGGGRAGKENKGSCELSSAEPIPAADERADRAGARGCGAEDMAKARGNSAAQYSTARTGNSKVRKHLTPNLTDIGCAKSLRLWGKITARPREESRVTQESSDYTTQWSAPIREVRCGETMHPQPADTEPRICTKTHSATQTAGTHETPHAE